MADYERITVGADFSALSDYSNKKYGKRQTRETTPSYVMEGELWVDNSNSKVLYDASVEQWTTIETLIIKNFDTDTGDFVLLGFTDGDGTALAPNVMPDGLLVMTDLDGTADVTVVADGNRCEIYYYISGTP